MTHSRPISFDQSDYRADVMDALYSTDMSSHDVGVVADQIVLAAELAAMKAIATELNLLADATIDESSANKIWYALRRRAREVTGDDVDQAGDENSPEL
jgi:hypothetical protein